MINVQELRSKPISEIIKFLENFINEDFASVDLAKLAYDLNVSVLPRNFVITKISGEIIASAFVTNSKGNSCIFYSDDLSNNQARIAITQAFAKYIITGNNNFFITLSTTFSKKENMLIHEMLMPESQVKDVICRLIFPTTFTLSQIFQVSQNFVRQRLDEMGVMTLIAGYHF